MSLVLSAVFGGAYLTYSNIKVMVSATVWGGNQAPVILSVNPSSVPVVLRRSAIQTFSIQVRDTDSPSVSYTITAGTGATNPINGTLTNTGALATGQSYIYFTYFTPPSRARTSNITVTLNDGSTVVVKNISIYIH